MVATVLKPNGYLEAVKTTGAPRNVEYQVFTRATGKLSRASRDGAEFRELAEALHENLSLWNVIATDVIDDDNALPNQLRAQLFYLYEFTRAHTKKVMRREADAAPLIDINTAVMRGLRQSVPGKGLDPCPV